jgi:Ca2+/Na+ antiporter
MLRRMTGVTGLLIKLGVRFVVFGLVFIVATRRNPKIVVSKRWAFPLIAAVFAILNTGLYWALRPLLSLATLGAAGFIMPLVVNLVLLLATIRVFQRKQWLEVKGTLATLWLAMFLTLAHGLLYVGLDYLPTKL